MAKKLSALLFLFLVFGFAASASAQTNTSTPTAKEQINNLKEQRKETLTNLKDEKKTELKQLRETVKIKREEAQVAIKTKREEFKAKLETIKDEKKKMAVERIDTKLAAVNTKHTDRFTEILEKLQMILDKVTNQDTTAAQKTIDDASKAVEEQAAKTYNTAITTEARLRTNVGAVTSKLRKDLMTTHKLVVAAKQAVQALRKDKMMNKEATDSANL